MPLKRSTQTRGGRQAGSGFDLATRWLDHHYRGPAGYTLRYWRNQFWKWTGTHYRVAPKDDIEKAILRWLDTQLPAATPHRARQVLECVEACTLVESHREQPVWLGKQGPADPRDWIATQNGILDLRALLAGEQRVLHPHSPMWFSPTVLPYAYTPTATCSEWLHFLSDVFDADEQRIALLQEWFGYCLTSDTSLQAIMMLEGTPRSGKGTTLRVLRKLVGEDNCVDPRLAMLATPFGLWGLIGKSVAVCSDVHLPRSGAALSVLEILKMISGEDAIEIHRKNLPSVSCRLRVRFTLAVNELPQFTDPSNALLPRLQLLPYRNNYSGRENRELESKLAAEIPGIFCWSIKGLRRLRQNGRFTEPRVSEVVRGEFARLSAPVKAFIEERCVVGSTKTVAVDDLWQEWKEWCEQNGHPAETKSLLGTQLRAAVPKLRTSRPRSKGTKRARDYVGIGLCQTGGSVVQVVQGTSKRKRKRDSR
jgi:putative DNA primase/helicase